MKRTIASIICVFTILIVPLAATAAERPLVFVADVDFAPYSMLIDGRPAGIDVEVLTEAARRAGLKVDIQFRQWDRLVKMVEKGECDGALSLFKNSDRERYAMFMEGKPIHYSDYVLFTRVGAKFPFGSYADLKGKKIGKIAGIELGAEFDKAASSGGMIVQEYQDITDAMRGLVTADIDAFAGNIDVTYWRLKEMGMTSSIVYLPQKLVEGKPSYLVISRASNIAEKAMIIQKLEFALDTMRKDGTYNAIAKRYLFRF